MGIFKDLDNDGLEQQEDRLGGYQVLDTSAYDAEISLAYAGKSANGAQFLTVHAKLDNGQEHRETLYVTNRKGENFWTNDADKKVPLPGYTLANNLCIVATDLPLNEQTDEEKIVKIYDFDEGKEMPKAVPVITSLIGKRVTLGILNVLENKKAKQGDKWAATADEKNANYIDNVFHEETKMTVAEALKHKGWDADKADFYQKWLTKNEGKVRDKREIKDGQGGTSGKPGAAPESGGTERRSLFK